MPKHESPSEPGKHRGKPGGEAGRHRGETHTGKHRNPPAPNPKPGGSGRTPDQQPKGKK